MKAVFIDMDGTILDDEFYYLSDIKRFMNQNGVDRDFEYIKRYIGASHEEFCEDIAKLFKCSVEEAENRRQEYNKLYPINYKELLKKDALFLLNYLKSNNYIVVLTTSASLKNTNDKIEACLIRKYFDYIITGEDVKKRKPFPDVYLKAIDKVKLSKIDCIAIEDSALGVKSAKDAGIRVILDYDKRINPNSSLADYIVYDLKEVIDILEE